MQVVTLIHGTWARDAPWTKDDSALCMELRKQFGTEEVVFRRFPWTGKNSFKARAKAAIDLREYLSAGLTEHPDSRHSIIAHSHGGNLVIEALEDPELRSRFSGIVCLSTPFICVSRSPSGITYGVINISVIFLRLVQVVVGVIGLILVFAAMLQPAEVPILMGMAATLLAITAGLLYLLQLLKRAIRKSSNGYDSRVLEFVARYKRQTCSDLDLLVIRPVADEASLSMQATQFAALFLTKIWTFIVPVQDRAVELVARLQRWSKRHRRILWISAAIIMGVLWIKQVAIPMAVEIMKVRTPSDLVPAVAFCAVTLIVYAMLTAAIRLWPIALVQWPIAIFAFLVWTVSAVLLLPVAIGLTLAVTPFGLREILIFPAVRITGEASPTGICKIVQLFPSEENMLMHSTTYQKRAAIDVTVMWLMGQLR